MKHLALLLLGTLLCSPAFAALRGTAGAGNGSTANSISVTVSGIGGSGPQLNDIVIIFIEGGGGSSQTFTYPSGFNAVPGLGNIALSTGNTVGVAYKVAGASEPSSYSIGYSTTDYLTARVWCFSGRNTSSPFSAVSTTSDYTLAASPATITMSGLTAAAGDDVLTLVGSQYYQGDSETYAAASGYANPQVDFATVFFSPVIMGSTYSNATAGATGTNGGVLTYAGSITIQASGYQLSIAAGAGSSCTHAGYTSAGAIATPNGSSGSYVGKTGALVTPNCSTVNYWQPAIGNFGVN